jgi:hypothetical protein
MPNRGTRLGSQGFGVESSIYLIRMQGHPNSPALKVSFDFLFSMHADNSANKQLLKINVRIF